jgi:hypothetical protein
MEVGWASVGEERVGPLFKEAARAWETSPDIYGFCRRLGYSRPDEPLELVGITRQERDHRHLGTFYALGPLILFQGGPGKDHLSGLLTRGNGLQLYRVVPFQSPRGSRSLDFWTCVETRGGEFALWREAGFDIFVEEMDEMNVISSFGIDRALWRAQFQHLLQRSLPEL